MFKKKDDSKPKSKKLIVGASIIVGVILVVLIFALTRKDSTNYLSVTENLISQPLGNFRYVFDVRTSEHTSSKTSSASDLATLEGLEADLDVDKILEEFQKNEKEFMDWGNSQGVEVINWEFPQYKVILEGNVASVEPLEMNLTISLATNYISDKLTDITIKDGKTYVNIEQLHYWLSNSKDASLITLGDTLPDNSRYVVYEGDAFNLFSTFAENSEVDLSRESNLVNLYKRFLVAEKVLVSNTNISSDCLTKENDIYKLNLTGGSAISFVNSLKSMSLKIGDAYKTVIKNQYKNKVMNEEQYKQALRETDNIISAFSDFNITLGTADVNKLDFQLSGNARNYVGGKGSTIYESSLAFQFTNNNVDYSVAIQLYKNSAVDKISVPIESSADISSFKDKDFMEKYLLKVLEHLNITRIKLENRLEITPDGIREDVLSSFIDLVNQVNAKDENFIELSRSNVYDFIDGYRDFEVNEETSEKDKLNSMLVEDFLNSFEYFMPEDEVVENTNEALEDESRFPSLVYSCDKFRVYANLNTEQSNVKCLLVDCYILNTSGSPLELTTSDFSLQTMQSSKYPANYKDLLLEYDNNFDFTKTPEKVNLGANQYQKVPMYFIISNGLEYMDLWYNSEKLGVIIAR